MADEPFQASYRRHRPRRFAEIRGQDHVTTALRNAVRGDRVAHAYLFSGPRGTGKTSAARILAAALNCAHPADGEPDAECESCLAIRAGTSLDVMELDAASNNGVDAMRDLVTRAALGSPGRWKVYIVDEVHMLTAAASNALLKTLEEPPGHVVFVLATTDDQKVLPTIRSRTQHYHFRLLPPETLASLLADVNEADSLGLDPAAIDAVVHKGHGSARDALSALDQAVAAGEAEDEGQVVPAIVEGMIAHDAGAVLVAVADAVRRGRDPHRVAVEIIQHLRAGFLLVMAPDVADVPAHEREALLDHARRLGTPATVRAMEVLGEALVDMREALDTRVTLEVALVRLSAPVADTSPAALLERLESLERRVAAGGPARSAEGVAGTPSLHGETPGVGTARSAPGATGTPSLHGETPGAGSARPVEGAAVTRSLHEETTGGGTGPLPPRQTIGALRQQAQQAQQPQPVRDSPPAGPPGERPSAAGSSLTLDRDELTKVWGDSIFAGLSARARAAYRPGRWLSIDAGTAVFALPSEMLSPAEGSRSEVEQAIAAFAGGRVAIRLQPEGAGAAAAARAAAPAAPRPPTREAREAPREWEPPPAPPSDLDADISSAEFAELPPAPEPALSAEARLLEAFPGTEEIPS